MISCVPIWQRRSHFLLPWGEGQDEGLLRKAAGFKIDAFHPLSDRHAIALYQFLRAIIYCQGDGEQNKANHEKCAVMNATPHHFPHLLGNDAGHGVDWLENAPNPCVKSGMAIRFPAQSSTTMVSPMTRPSPSRIADTIPERDAGTITRPMVWRRLAPSA